MIYIRKEIKNYINENDFSNFIEKNLFQQRDILIFYCENCKKEVKVKFNNKKYWNNGLLCKQCKTGKTNLEKYGSFNVFGSLEIKNKIKKTNNEKYGGNSSMNSPEIAKKAKETCLKKYGGSPLRSREVYSKFKETCLEKYGVSHPMKVKEISTKASISIMKKRFNELKSFNIENLEPLFDFSKYSGNKISNKYLWKCKICGTIFKDHIYAGRKPRCPKCFNNKSQLEIEVANLLKNKIDLQMNKKFFKTNNYFDGSYEIDIFIPEKNLGIEFDGLYWHSENMVGKNYHLDKYNFFKEKNIRIINIFEDEWIYKKEIVLSILLSKLGLFEKKYYARECKIKKINNIEEKDFLEKNHIQGYVGSYVCYGAFFNEELVSVMSFGKSRFNKKYEWELLRFANLINTTNIGIYNKIYKVFFNEFNPKSIISYCDLRYFDGGIYNKIGLELLRTSKPNYFYIKNKKRFSRVMFQKHKLKNLLENFDINKTEKDNMFINGYSRIFDVGNKVFAKKF